MPCRSRQEEPTRQSPSDRTSAFFLKGFNVAGVTGDARVWVSQFELKA
jgi:hypothetical protein